MLNIFEEFSLQLFTNIWRLNFSIVKPCLRNGNSHKGNIFHTENRNKCSQFYMKSLSVKTVIGCSSVLFALHTKWQTNLRLISIVISPLLGSERVRGERVRRWEVGGSVAKSRPEFLSRSQWKQIMLPSIWRLTKTYSDQHSTQHPRFYNTSTTLCVSQCAQGFQERSQTVFFCS